VKQLPFLTVLTFTSFNIVITLSDLLKLVITIVLTLPLDSANAAQVGRVNVASGFRQTHMLQVFKSTKRSEILRPNFNQVFRTSLSTCQSISVSIALTAHFRKVPKIFFRNFKSFRYKTLRCISSFLRQSLVLIRRYQKVEFDLRYASSIRKMSR
jgi:hypothetical protein